MGRRDLDYDEVLRYIGQFGTFQVGLKRPGYTLCIASTLSVRKRFFFVRERSSSGSGWCLQGAVLLWWSLPSQVPFPATLFCNHQRSSQTCKLWKIMTGLEPRYRCRVPECELANSSIYTQEGRGGLLPSWWFTMSVEKNNMRSTIIHALHIILSAIAKWKRNLKMVIIEAMATIWRRSCWKVRCGFFRRSSALFEACFPRWQVLWRERWVVRV